MKKFKKYCSNISHDFDKADGRDEVIYFKGKLECAKQITKIFLRRLKEASDDGDFYNIIEEIKEGLEALEK